MEWKKVLLIEDEELILEGLKSIIDWEALGLRVVCASPNGRAALESLAGETVDIIVTDISMPIMDGLSFLEEYRKRDERARCIILTGYEEFEYARKAIRLDVEDYILKPINEDKLEEVLLSAVEKLKLLDKKRAVNADDKTGWLQLLRGQLSEAEVQGYLSVLPGIGPGVQVYPAIMKISLSSLKSVQVSDVLLEMQAMGGPVRVIFLTSDTLLLLYFAGANGEGANAGNAREDIKAGGAAKVGIIREGIEAGGAAKVGIAREGIEAVATAKAEISGNPTEADIQACFEAILDRLEGSLGVMTFISIGDGIDSYDQLADSYETARKNQKYQLVEGFGSCIAPWKIKKLKSRDVDMDEASLRRLILKKDREGCHNYIEDLFINNVRENMSVDDIYQMSLKMAMVLSDLKKEYKLTDNKNMQNITELVDAIYRAEDIQSLKAIFLSETAEIIASLNLGDSKFTPVVKQIISEVQNNICEDMNLKTLSYKYHMNASYLGQIFQKEVGCSFAQYVTNLKNSRAKDMILNTSMRINDIAQAVGYTDISYFYRKFKQSYGVSPATLREMRKY